MNIPADTRQTAMILCVDDDPSILRVRRFILEAQGYRVLAAENGISALRIFDEARPDLVVLDYSMPEMNGDLVAMEMRRRRPAIPLVLLSAYLDLPEAIVSVFDVYVTKGENPEILLTHISRLLRRYAAA